jgi:hypothetical protein
MFLIYISHIRDPGPGRGTNHEHPPTKVLIQTSGQTMDAINMTLTDPLINEDKLILLTQEGMAEADVHVEGKHSVALGDEANDGVLHNVSTLDTAEEESNDVQERQGDTAIAVLGNHSTVVDAVSDKNDETNDMVLRATTDFAASNQTEGHGNAVPANDSFNDTFAPRGAVLMKKPSDSPALNQHANHDLKDQSRNNSMDASEEELNNEGQEEKGDAATAELAENDSTALVKHVDEEVLAGNCITSIAPPVHEEGATDEDVEKGTIPSIEPEAMLLAGDRNVALAPPAINDSQAALQIPPAEPGRETGGPPIAAHASRDASFRDCYKEGPSAFGKEAEEQMLQVGPDEAPDNGKGPRHDGRSDPGPQYAKEKKRPSSSDTFLGAAITKKYRSHSLGSGQASIALVESVEGVLTDNEATMTTEVPLEVPDAPHSAEYIRGLSVAVECCLDQVLNGVADRASMWRNAQVSEFVQVPV